MALQKATKTILLSSGMAEQADSFLLDSPAMEYIENGKFDKDGVISKRRGFTALPSNGLVVGTDGTPNIMFELEGTLFVISDTKIKKFDGTAWSDVTTSAFLATSEKRLETEVGHSISGIKYVDVGSNREVICFSTFFVKNATAGDEDYDYRIKLFIINSTTKTVEKIVTRENAHNCYIYKSSTGLLGLIWADFTGGGTSWQIKTGTMDVTVSTPSITVIETMSTACTGLNLYSNPSDRDVRTRRISFSGAIDGEVASSQNVQYPMFVCSQDEAAGGTTSYISIAWTSLAYNLNVSSIARSTMALVSGPVSITAASKGKDALIPLACTANALLANIVLYTGWDYNITTQLPESAELYLDSRVVTTLSTVNYALNKDSALGDKIPTHGSICVDVGGVGLFLFHAQDSGVYSSFKLDPVRGDGIYGAYIDAAGANTATQTLIEGHRLTTNIVKDATGNYFAGVQRFWDGTSWTNTLAGAGDLDNYLFTAPVLKTTTTLLVKFVGGSAPLPVASLSANVAKIEDHAFAGVRKSLSSLCLNGNNFIIADRLIEKSDDVWVGWGGNATHADKIDSGMVSSSLSKAVITDINRGLENVEVSVVKDGAIIHAAIPYWFDGVSLREGAPFDSPQLINIPYTDIYQPITTAAFSPVDNWGKIQSITVFTDAKGNITRSSPTPATYDCDTFADKPPSLRYFQLFRTIAVNQQKKYPVETYFNLTTAGDPQLLGISEIGEVYSDVGFRIFINNFTSFSGEAVPMGGPFIYTSGGVLASEAWPDLSQTVVTSKRVFGISKLFSGLVFYSKLFEDGVTPEFNSILSLSLGTEKKLTAIGKIDDKVVIFEPNNIHVIYGDGPDNTGRGGDFSTYSISTKVGTEDPQSVVETPRGLVFKDKRGFYLLDRALDLHFIGEPIQDISLSMDVTSAQIITDQGEVRFCVQYDGSGFQIDPDGPTPAASRPPAPKYGNAPPTDACFVWNYERNLWSVFSNYQANASTIYQNKYTRLLSDWSVWQETDDDYRDPTGTNRLKLITPWIRLGNMQDFGRLFKITFLGKYLSAFRLLGSDLEAGDIKVTVHHDYEANESPSAQNYTFRANVDLQKTPPTAMDVGAQRLQFSLRPKKQKTQSIQLEIEEVPTTPLDTETYTLGRGFEIVSCDIEYGLKGSSTKNLPKWNKH